MSPSQESDPMTQLTKGDHILNISADLVMSQTIFSFLETFTEQDAALW